MSNALSIAAATMTLRRLLFDAIQPYQPGATVTTEPLDRATREGTSKRLNLYLFLTTPNATFRNMQSPPDGQDGPALALQLHYLLTPFGDDPQEEFDHRLLGLAKLALQTNSVLNPDLIRSSTSGTVPDEFDLHRQQERVRIVWQPMQADEMSKLWALFSQTPYRHSEVYIVSPILIDSTQRKPLAKPVLSVGPVLPDGRDYGVFIDSGAAPLIIDVKYKNIKDGQKNLIPYESAVSDEVISIFGRRLRRANEVVIILEEGAVSREIARYIPEKIDDERLVVQLKPTPDWVSGRLSLAVKFLTSRGARPSNLVPLEIAPEIVVSAGGVSAFTQPENGRRMLIVNLRYPLRPKAEPTLILSSVGSQVSVGPLRAELDSNHITPTSVVFNITNVVSGKYRVAVSVDGIESRYITRNGVSFQFDSRMEIEL